MKPESPHIANKYKGSFLGRALVVAVLLVPVLASGSARLDTLILDGMTIRLDEELEVDTVWVDPADGQKPEEKRSYPPGDKGWSVGLAVGPKICRYKAASSVPEMNTLESFVENGTKAVIGVSGGAEFRYDFPGSLSIRSGIELSLHGWNANYFDPAALNDSLFAFESPGSGELNQILRFRYQGLGTEFDTLSTAISVGKFRLMALDIPLMISYEFPVKELGRLQHLEAGVGVVNRIHLITKADQATLINAGGDWRTLESEDFDPSSYWLMGRAELSWFMSNNARQKYWGARLYFQTPVIATNVSPETLDIQGLESGVTVFFRFFLN